MLTRWSDPFRELQAFQHQVDRLFDDAFGGRSRLEEGLTTAWSPAVDILETKDSLVFTAELPGFKQEDLTLRVEGGVLTLQGERKFEKESRDRSYHRVERAYGQFVRSFSLPPNVNAEKISAELVDGVLTVEMPKKEEAKPKSIPIGVSPKQIGPGKKAA